MFGGSPFLGVWTFVVRRNLLLIDSIGKPDA